MDRPSLWRLSLYMARETLYLTVIRPIWCWLLFRRTRRIFHENLPNKDTFCAADFKPVLVLFSTASEGETNKISMDIPRFLWILCLQKKKNAMAVCVIFMGSPAQKKFFSSQVHFWDSSLLSFRSQSLLHLACLLEESQKKKSPATLIEKRYLHQSFNKNGRYFSLPEAKYS